MVYATLAEKMDPATEQAFKKSLAEPFDYELTPAQRMMKEALNRKRMAEAQGRGESNLMQHMRRKK